MTKKEHCENRSTVAYYSGLGGLEIKFISNGKKSYNRLKIHYGAKSVYICLFGRRCPLSEFIRT